MNEQFSKKDIKMAQYRNELRNHWLKNKDQGLPVGDWQEPSKEFLEDLIEVEPLVHFCKICKKTEFCMDDITHDCDFRVDFSAHGICMYNERHKSTIYDPQVKIDIDEWTSNPEKLRELLSMVQKQIDTANPLNQDDLKKLAQAMICKKTLERLLRGV